MSCEKLKQNLLIDIQYGMQDVVIPVCDADGNFEAVQSSGYPLFETYCVDRKTGKQTYDTKCLPINNATMLTNLPQNSSSDSILTTDSQVKEVMNDFKDSIFAKLAAKITAFGIYMLS